jgi:hypothetical protein
VLSKQWFLWQVRSSFFCSPWCIGMCLDSACYIGRCLLSSRMAPTTNNKHQFPIQVWSLLGRLVASTSPGASKSAFTIDKSSANMVSTLGLLNECLLFVLQVVNLIRSTRRQGYANPHADVIEAVACMAHVSGIACSVEQLWGCTSIPNADQAFHC